jgi:hypothetical protein
MKITRCQVRAVGRMVQDLPIVAPCGYLCVAWRYRAAVRRLFAATQVVFDEFPPATRSVCHNSGQHSPYLPGWGNQQEARPYGPKTLSPWSVLIELFWISLKVGTIRVSMSWCFLRLRCHMMHPRFIACNNALQELHSLLMVPRQVHERQSHPSGFMNFCALLRYPAWTHFPVPQLLMNYVVHSADWDVKFVSNITKSSASVLLNQTFNAAHIVICGERAWPAGSLLILNVCPAVVKGSAPNPNVFLWHDVSTVHLNKLAVNFSWWCAFQSQKSDYTMHLLQLMTDMRRGLVSVRGNSALPALTLQEIWMK